MDVTMQEALKIISTLPSGKWDEIITYTPVFMEVIKNREIKKEKNPFVPMKIFSNVTARTVVVLWEDGEKSKVTCDVQDNFSVELGFAIALTQRLFGGKSEFKKKWWPIISRRIQDTDKTPF